ncbi:MAG: DUF4169 family protein [Mesorhizobium sp.]|nr:DUF4169 family protein [Mesorhizobium sp.]
MAEIVNLRLARKRKAREDEADRAAANRALHGRTKAEKRADRATRDQAARFLDGHRRAQDPSVDPLPSDPA